MVCMGLFDMLKARIANRQSNYGAAFYHFYRSYVNTYFDSEPIKGAESEAILLHAAMIRLLLKIKFPERGAEAWEEYVGTMCYELKHKSEFEHRLLGSFIMKRIDYYEIQWVDLLYERENL